MISWNRLFEFGYGKSEITMFSKQFASVYDFARSQKAESDDRTLVFKEFDSIYLLMDFGMSLITADKLFSMGITSVRISMRRSSKKLIEREPNDNSETILRSLYKSRILFGEWMKTVDAQTELESFVQYSIGENSLFSKEETKDLNNTILFLNKHFSADLSMSNKNDTIGLHKKSDEEKNNKNVLALNKNNQSVKDFAHSVNKQLSMDEVIQRFWLLDFDIRLNLYKTLQSNNMSLTSILETSVEELPKNINKEELRGIKRRIESTGLIKDSVSLLVGFHVSPRTVDFLKKQGIIHILQLTDERVSRLLLSKLFNAEERLSSELNQLQKSINRYYDWEKNTTFSSRVVNLILLSEKNSSSREDGVASNESEFLNQKLIENEEQTITDSEKKKRRLRKNVFGFEKLPKNLTVFFELNLKEDASNVLFGRMSGKTLQEIADNVGVSRERIRQIESRIKKSLPEFSEEQKLKKIFKLYYFDDEEFSRVFGMDARINSFMKWKYGGGNRPHSILL